jgi:hypothetical protein
MDDLLQQKKTEANAQQSQIHCMDKEKDQMVCALYGLREEEIGLWRRVRAKPKTR